MPISAEIDENESRWASTASERVAIVYALRGQTPGRDRRSNQRRPGDDIVLPGEVVTKSKGE